MLDLLELDSNLKKWDRIAQEIRSSPNSEVMVNLYNNTIWFRRIGVAIVDDCESEDRRIKFGTCLVINLLGRSDKQPALFTLSKFESIILKWRFNRMVKEVKKRVALHQLEKDRERTMEELANTWRQTARVLKEAEDNINGKK